MSKKVIDALIAMHIQAEIPWRPGDFVVPDAVPEDWLTEEEEVWAIVSVFVVDRFFASMITSR